MRLASACLGIVAALAGPATAAAGVVAFSSDRCPEAYEEGCTKSLWTVADDGTGLTRITPTAAHAPPNEASFDDQPSWSPDGRYLLYRRDIHARPGLRSLWVTSLDGALKFQVGPDAPNANFDSYNEPEWSPDGAWIAFNGRPADAPRTEEGGGRSAIWLMSIDGTVLRRLTDGSGGDGAPTFSPDGRRIAFVRGRATSDGLPGLLTMNLDGSDVAPVLVGTPPGARESIVPGALRASWSPDGRQFALAYQEDLYTMRADGTALESRGRTGVPTSIGAAFSRLVWSTEPEPALIYSLPMEGRPLQRLELTGPQSTGQPLTPPVTNSGNPGYYTVGDDDPDWHPTVPVVPSPEVDPPIVLPIDLGSGGPAAARASRRNLSVRRRNLGFLAVDSAGVRRVDVAIARRVKRRGRRARCRYAGNAGLGRPRSCSPPVWRRVRGAADLARLLRRLRPGPYLLQLRALDGLANRTEDPRIIRLSLRP